MKKKSNERKCGILYMFYTVRHEKFCHVLLSHPARGAWIEIGRAMHRADREESHPARGAWIEIPPPEPTCSECLRRTPRGVRGLKLLDALCSQRIQKSHPARGAWIEILHILNHAFLHQSHPARGAWIEMVRLWLHQSPRNVAPREGCVD